MTTTRPLGKEHCRDCRDTLPYGSPIPEADFILWGKFFPQEAFGPKCMAHASRWFPVNQVDQYAVYDLREVRKLREQAEQDERLAS